MPRRVAVTPGKKEGKKRDRLGSRAGLGPVKGVRAGQRTDATLERKQDHSVSAGLLGRGRSVEKAGRDPGESEKRRRVVFAYKLRGRSGRD